MENKMEITKPENIAIGKFYWLTLWGKERIGEAINFYGDVMFSVTGFSDMIDFDNVSNIYPVCLIKH